jgi:polar amino acid transport system substrate-binding protein
MLKKLIKAVAIGASIAVMSHAVYADALSTIKSRGKLLVAIDLGNPPHGFKDEKFETVGSDVDTARLLAKDMGVELEIVQVATPNRVQYLLTNKADIVISALSITPDRKKVIDFSIPYAELNCIVAAPTSMKIANYADLAGMGGVAVTRGTVNDQWVTKGTEGVSDVKITRFEDDPTSTTAITSGQLQIYATSLPLLNQLKKTNPNVDLQVKFVMNGFPLGIALRKNEPQLQSFLNTWVETNLKNGKLVDTYKKWHGVTLKADELIAQKN